MRAVVTGCAGFIGSHLSERLVADGWRVTGIDALTPYYDPIDKMANLEGLADDSRFELRIEDVVDAPSSGSSPTGPWSSISLPRPECGPASVTVSARYLHDNVLATQRVLEAAQAAGCPRVVMASSSSVYGDAETVPGASKTSTPTRPRSPYGVAKRACEELAAIYRHQGLETVALRYFTVYGPRQRPDMAFRRLCEAAYGGEPFALYGDGGQSRDFTFVDDVVDATVGPASSSRRAALINVGGGQEATMNEVIATIEALSGRPLAIERGPVQRGDVRRTGRTRRGRERQLGWGPHVSLAAGLAAELDWVRRSGVRASGAAHGGRNGLDVGRLTSSRRSSSSARAMSGLPLAMRAVRGRLRRGRLRPRHPPGQGAGRGRLVHARHRHQPRWPPRSPAGATCATDDDHRLRGLRRRRHHRAHAVA